MYISANLDASYCNSDNWGSLALLLQLMQTLRTQPTERARTAFLFGHAESGFKLAHMGQLPAILDLLIVSQSGLVNGRDSLYHNHGPRHPHALSRTVFTSIIASQVGYLSGRGPISRKIPILDITSYAPTPKTVHEASSGGGLAGLAVSATTCVRPLAVTDVSIETLIAQLKTLKWVIAAGVMSDVGVTVLFEDVATEISHTAHAVLTHT
jgi:hypothetical protein